MTNSREDNETSQRQDEVTDIAAGEEEKPSRQSGEEKIRTVMQHAKRQPSS